MDKIIMAKDICSINIVKHKQTIKQLTDLIDFIEEQQISTCSLSVNNNILINIDEQIQNFKNFVDVSNYIINYIKIKKYNLSFRPEGCLQYLFTEKIKKIPKTNIENIFSKCEAANLKLEILPDGNSIGCMALYCNEKFLSNNVLNNGILNVWHNDKILNKLRNLKCNDNMCKLCKYKKFCNGGCPAQRYLSNKDLTNKRDLRCIAKK